VKERPKSTQVVMWTIRAKFWGEESASQNNSIFEKSRRKK
jgi:hypothetical protein